jgi:hypothetical protein
MIICMQSGLASGNMNGTVSAVGLSGSADGAELRWWRSEAECRMSALDLLQTLLGGEVRLSVRCALIYHISTVEIFEN